MMPTLNAILLSMAAWLAMVSLVPHPNNAREGCAVIVTITMASLFLLMALVA